MTAAARPPSPGPAGDHAGDISTDDRTDATVVAALRAGDEPEFRRLVLELTPVLLALARRYVDGPGAAEDVVQETWITVLDRLDGFEQGSTLRTWVCGVLVHKARRLGTRDRRSLPFSAVRRDERAPAVDPGRFHSRSDAAHRHLVDPAAALGPGAGGAAGRGRAAQGHRRGDRRAAGPAAGGDDAAGRARAGRGRSQPGARGHRGQPARAAAPGAQPGPGRGGELRWRRRPGGEAARMTREVVCRQLVELVTDYLDGALAARDRAAVEAHLAECDDCDGYVAQVRRMLELTRTVPAEPVPPALLDRLSAEFRRRH